MSGVTLALVSWLASAPHSSSAIAASRCCLRSASRRAVMPFEFSRSNVAPQSTSADTATVLPVLTCGQSASFVSSHSYFLE
eukprot:1176864-Prorocentrum_minimum.AAC.2